MSNATTGQIFTVSPQEVHRRRTAGDPAEVIDVRTPAEFQQLHADVARNVPLGSPGWDAIVRDRDDNADQPLYILCHAGDRARQACQELVAAGCGRVVAVEGGTRAWTEAGLPVIVGKTNASAVERQTRMTIGSLVLLGVLLGWMVHPGLAAVSACMGIGLVYAGMSGRCGMASLLARMPWNRARGPQAANPAAGCPTCAAPQETAAVDETSGDCCSCG